MQVAPSLGWLGLVALGAGHGLNPGMGWLFAVARGLQERSGKAVWRALGPMAAGHAAAVALALVAAALLGAVLDAGKVKLLVAMTLVIFGLWRFTRTGHPRYGGMQVTPLQLGVWSLLMASAHGAGVMVVPFANAGGGHAHHGMPALPSPVLATALHTGSYLAVTALVALVVYYRVGLRFLRENWVNLDLVWGGALVVTGVGVMLLG